MGLDKENRYKWEKNHVYRFSVGLQVSTDADIIGKLESVESKQGYIKKLIRADLLATRHSQEPNKTVSNESEE